jgi:thioredoxin-dependent peroxiredoxin
MEINNKSNLEGKKAPNFSINNQNGQRKTLKDFEGSFLLLYFYPKDMTPGCTTQACSFNENIDKLKKLGVEVVGISCDSEEKHQKFINKYNLSFDLLADIEQKTVEKYGVWVEKSMYGKKYMGIQRDSFLIDPKGKIVKHYIKVKPAGHVAEVIKDIKEIELS